MAISVPLPASPSALDPAFVEAFRRGKVTRAQTDELVRRDPLELSLLLLQLSAAMAASTIPIGPNTPSGAMAPFLKSEAAGPKKRRKKSGAKPGHPGVARPVPGRIDRRVVHQLPVCPCCSGRLHRTGRKRVRYVEDIPDDLHAEATEHTLHRDWCPRCQKQVEPVVPDALPRCQIGHRAATLSAWLHYGLGTTTSQVAEVLNGHLQLEITTGGLTQIWHRLAEVLLPWYEQIQERCLNAAVLHADETSWRDAASLAWLWCFGCADSTYYLIHPKRGHEALKVFFSGAFEGVLVTDFWKAYDVITRSRQKCWPHLLRELADIDEGKKDNGDDWPEFSKKLWRIYGDAVRLRARIDAFDGATYDRRTACLYTRMTDLAVAAWRNPHARRLAQRLVTYGDDLLTFVELRDVPSSNNRAEREVRPAVMMRKVSQGCVGKAGCQTRSVLMSIYRTLKLRGLDPLQVTQEALKTYTLTGKLPPLPEKNGSIG